MSETKEDLLKKLQELKEKEKAIDNEIQELEASGVKDTDATDIMKALHDYNEIKDIVVDVFNVLIKLKQTTSAALHIKYSIPTEE